jgi:hypothetical protein
MLNEERATQRAGIKVNQACGAKALIINARFFGD